MRRFRTGLVFLALAIAFPARAQDRIDVVASFSILGDFVQNVGGDRVNVSTLVGPDGDVHVYAPSPSDARTIAQSKLLVINGLGLEGWLPRLLQASGSKAKIATFDTNKQLVGAIQSGQVQWAVDQQPYLQGYLAVDGLWLYKTNGNVSGGGDPVLTGPAFIDSSNIASVAQFAANGTR